MCLQKRGGKIYVLPFFFTVIGFFGGCNDVLVPGMSYPAEDLFLGDSDIPTARTGRLRIGTGCVLVEALRWLWDRWQVLLFVRGVISRHPFYRFFLCCCLRAGNGWQWRQGICLL